MVGKIAHLVPASGRNIREDGQRKAKFEVVDAELFPQKRATASAAP